MFLAVIYNPNANKKFGAIYTLAAKVEGDKVTIGLFWVGRHQVNVYQLLEDHSLLQIKFNEGHSSRIKNTLENLKAGNLRYLTFSTKKTFEELEKWQIDNRKELSDYVHPVGKNCTDYAKRLYEFCNIKVPKNNSVARAARNGCASLFCGVTCACCGVLSVLGLVACKFPLYINTPHELFSALEKRAKKEAGIGSSPDFLKIIYGNESVLKLDDECSAPKEEKMDDDRKKDDVEIALRMPLL